MKLSTLKRDFLATFPAIGSHYEIEAELLLAGIKPVGWFEITDEIPSHPIFQKRHADRLKLDEAVKAGKLSSTDINNSQAGYWQRLYCQPGLEEQMHLVAKTEKGEIPASLYEHGRRMGYRRRDAFYFEATFPRFKSEALSKIWSQLRLAINKPVMQAHRNALLEAAGVNNPDTYLDDIYKSLE